MPRRFDAFERMVRDPSSLYTAMAKSSPALQRGLVRCGACKTDRTVNSAECLRTGWPKCCGYTMRLVSDAEKA